MKRNQKNEKQENRNEVHNATKNTETNMVCLKLMGAKTSSLEQMLQERCDKQEKKKNLKEKEFYTTKLKTIIPEKTKN
jgi:hypothetical protein